MHDLFAVQGGALDRRLKRNLATELAHRLLLAAGQLQYRPDHRQFDLTRPAAPLPESVPEPVQLLFHPQPEPEPIPPRPDKPHALRIWVRELSHRARKRLDEAYHRLAS